MVNNFLYYHFMFAESCVALNFINNLGSPFKLYSSLKHEGYFVTGSGMRLKLTIVRPELHSHVTFNAEDVSGNELLLNGQTSIAEQVVFGCPKFLDVSVTSKQGNLMKSVLKNMQLILGGIVSAIFSNTFKSRKLHFHQWKPKKKKNDSAVLLKVNILVHSNYQ